MIRHLFAAIAFLVISWRVTSARADSWFPFVIPWDDASHTVVNVGSLNATPAGKDGFIQAKGGHFVDGRGQRIRFFGTNLTFNANFPDKADARKVAARLHKYGFNIVRLHHMDFFHAPRGIFDPAFKDMQHLDKEQMDRLDYFIAQLKAHGIYININLHVSRAFTAADGFPDTDRLPNLGKAVDFFEPRMIELQKNYARDLLAHLNPYTHTRYVDEPAVAVVEVNNENTLLGEAWGSTIDKLPDCYRAELGRQWNGWLKKRYGATAKLRVAWKVTDKPFGPNLLTNAEFNDATKNWMLENHAPAKAIAKAGDAARPSAAMGKAIHIDITKLSGQNWHIQFHQARLDLQDGEPYTLHFWARANVKRSMALSSTLDQADWHSIGLNQRVDLDPQWRRYEFVFTANRTVPNHGRLSFILGDSLGSIELADVSLRQGVANAFPKDASVESGTIPLGHPSISPAGTDWIRFLIDTEKHYLTTMRDYLKKDLGTHALITGSQASYGGLGGALRETLSDFTDMHAYWQHPHFPHRAWDPVDWRIDNTPMVRDPKGGTFPGLARYRLAGKPFTVSEYNHSAPSDYQAECTPMLAAFAALQDWDGIYLFDYNSDRNSWNKTGFKGFFSIDTNPAKMAFQPAAALLFLRGDLKPARGVARLEMTESSLAEFMAKNGRWADGAWDQAGSPRVEEALTRRLELGFIPGDKALLGIYRNGRAPNTIVSGPVVWTNTGTDQALFSVDSPSSKVVAGYLSGRPTPTEGWEISQDRASFPFAAWTLSALDAAPLAKSHAMLLTVVGRVKNTDMQWNAERTSVGNHWGHGPALIEGVEGKVAIQSFAKSATIYALDATGKRKQKVNSSISAGRIRFDVSPRDETVWYEIAAD